MKHNQQIAELIRELMAEHELTHDQFSRKIFCKKDRVKTWVNETITPRLKDLILISKVFSVKFVIENGELSVERKTND